MKTGNLSVLGLVTGLTKDEVGLGNVANELQLYASQLSTDGTLSADSDSLVPSQKAVKTYADQLLSTASALTFKGSLDLSGNPNYPAAVTGDVYTVSVAGKIGGASGVSLTQGDLIICITDNAGGTQASVGADFTTIQLSLNGIVIGPSSSTDGDFCFFNGTSGAVIEDSGIALSADGTMASNSDSLVPTQKAVVTYVNAQGFLTSADGVSSFNTRTGDVTLESSDVTTALGYTPVQSVSGTSGRISSTGSTTPVLDLVTTAVTPGSYTLTSLTVDAYGRITSASSYTLVESDITTALGYTPVAPASMESGENNIIAFLDSDGNLVDSHLLVTTDGTLSADSDSVIPTEKAVKTYADTKVSSVSGTSGRISSTGSTTPVLDLVTTAVTPGSYTTANITVDAYGRVTSASNGSAGSAQTPWTADEDAAEYNLYNLNGIFDSTDSFELIDTSNNGQNNLAGLSFHGVSGSGIGVYTQSNTLDDGDGNSIFVGNVNVGTFTLTLGGTTGAVLTSDASGNGTWQTLNLSGYVPYTGANEDIDLNNNSISNVAFLAINQSAVINATAQNLPAAFTVYDKNSGLALQVTNQDGNGDYVQTLNNILDDGSGNMRVVGQLTTTTFEMTTGASSGYVLTSDGSGNASWTAPVSSPVQRGTFTDGDLVSGNVLVITHNLALTAPFAVVVAVFDNNGNQVLPDAIVGATNSVDVDLSSYGSLTGTWGWVLVG